MENAVPIKDDSAQGTVRLAPEAASTPAKTADKRVRAGSPLADPEVIAQMPQLVEDLWS